MERERWVGGAGEVGRWGGRGGREGRGGRVEWGHGHSVVLVKVFN